MGKTYLIVLIIFFCFDLVLVVLVLLSCSGALNEHHPPLVALLVECDDPGDARSGPNRRLRHIVREALRGGLRHAPRSRGSLLVVLVHLERQCDNIALGLEWEASSAMISAVPRRARRPGPSEKGRLDAEVAAEGSAGSTRPP